MDENKEIDYELAKEVARAAAKELADKDSIYFDKMVGASDKLVKPWITSFKWAIAALIATNLIWATVHFYSIYKAYQDPVTYEYSQNQNQDGENQQQEANGKGGGN